MRNTLMLLAISLVVLIIIATPIIIRLHNFFECRNAGFSILYCAFR